MKFFVSAKDRKPDPEPIKSNTRAVALVGVVLWTITLVILLFFPAVLPTLVKPWWPFTCIVGIVLGLVFYFKFGSRK